MTNVYVGNYLKIYLKKVVVPFHHRECSCNGKRVSSKFCPNCGSGTNFVSEEEFQGTWELTLDNPNLVDKFAFVGGGSDEDGARFEYAVPNMSQCGKWVYETQALSLEPEPWHADFDELKDFLQSNGVSFECHTGIVFCHD